MLACGMGVAAISAVAATLSGGCWHCWSCCQSQEPPHRFPGVRRCHFRRLYHFFRGPAGKIDVFTTPAQLKVRWSSAGQSGADLGHGGGAGLKQGRERVGSQPGAERSAGPEQDRGKGLGWAQGPGKGSRGALLFAVGLGSSSIHPLA